MTVLKLEVPTYQPTLKTLQFLFKTDCGAGPMIARLMLGIVMFPHGAQKMLGWFGGHGFSGTMNFFTGTMHIPAVFAFLAILAEFGGSLGLIIGLCSRVAAFGREAVSMGCLSSEVRNLGSYRVHRRKFCRPRRRSYRGGSVHNNGCTSLRKV